VGKPEGKTVLRIRRWKGNIKLDLRQTGQGGLDWSDLAQGSVIVNNVMYGSIICLEY
jgi:hypothetical protein